MIRFTRTYLKPVALFISIIVLFQCCVVYDKQKPVQVEQAIGTHEKGVKVITNDDRQFIFNSLYYEEDILYGELHKPKAGQEVTVKINPDSIKEIRLFSEKKTRIVRIVLSIVVIGGFIWGSVYAMNNISYF